MKRKALIIGNSGNSDEYLEGVEKDINNYKNFLKSPIGGAWYNDEIVISLDETKEDILQKISKIREEMNDFVFILFSGHGSYSLNRECRKLYIYDDSIYENNLLYLASKQITIMDTCAGVEDDLLKESAMMDSIIALEHHKDNTVYRILYESEIENSPRQQVILYSSSIDESSGDDSELGGYFAYNLLKVARRNIENILDTRKAYLYAKKIVQNKTNNEQNPQCKCSRSNNILPFSIKG